MSFPWSNLKVKKLGLFIALIFVTLIIGCQATFYVKVTDISDPSYPCFSVSQSRFLPWAKGMWNNLYISEVDETGKEIKTVWLIEPIENVNIKEFCYGQVPTGYKEVAPAQPLEIGKFYLVYPGGIGCYLRMVRDQNEVKVEVYSSVEFYGKFVNN